MARRNTKLTAKRRKSLPKKVFGLPGKRKYPMDTRGRAANAKARATQQFNRGRLSKSALGRINVKANKILGTGRSRS